MKGIKRRNGKLSRFGGLGPSALLLFILAAAIALMLTASADPGWSYRRAINITNSGGSDLTDYQVLVTLNTTNFDYSKTNADGSDLRFTNYANSTKYNYWLETWNTAGESRIWVNVSSVPDGNSKMYLWYGNSAASSESDGNATFNFFDDFEGETEVFSDGFENGGTGENTVFSDDFEDGNIDGWTTGGNAGWYADGSTAHGGNYSAGSGDISDSQNTWIKKSVTLSRAGYIEFYWKVSSESGFDKLRFYIDGSEKASFSGSQDWALKQIDLSSGTHELKWQYSKDGSSSTGSDAGWIDDVQVIERSMVTDGWETGGTGNAEWYVVSSTKHDGSYSARGGHISHSQNTWLKRNVAPSHEGYIEFYWKVSSESGFDKLRFYIDGSEKASFSGSQDWALKRFDLASGTHELKWQYSRDSSGSSGSNTGWVDDIKIIELSGLKEGWSTGGNAEWYETKLASYEGQVSTRGGDISDLQNTWLKRDVTLSDVGRVEFYWKVSSESGCDWLRFDIGGSEKAKISGSQDWALRQFDIASGTHELKWQYSKDFSGSSGSDTGWVDLIMVRKYASPEPTTSVSATVEDTGGAYPVPELPTIILFCIGLLVLAGYVCVVRRMRRK